jgi:hypothetical protein
MHAPSGGGVTLNVAEALLWIVLFVAWAAVTIWTVVHLAVRVHAPPWAVVLFAVVVFVVPYLAVLVYWLAFGAVLLSRRRSTKAGQASRSDAPGEFSHG